MDLDACTMCLVFSVAAGPKEDDVAFLVSMGFDRPRALRALQAKVRSFQRFS